MSPSFTITGTASFNRWLAAVRHVYAVPVTIARAFAVISRTSSLFTGSRTWPMLTPLVHELSNFPQVVSILNILWVILYDVQNQSLVFWFVHDWQLSWVLQFLPLGMNGWFYQKEAVWDHLTHHRYLTQAGLFEGCCGIIDSEPKVINPFLRKTQRKRNVTCNLHKVNSNDRKQN